MSPLEDNSLQNQKIYVNFDDICEKKIQDKKTFIAFLELNLQKIPNLNEL
jgi:hypothetical protein